MNTKDVSFGFDPKPFMSGLSKLDKGITGLTKRIAGQAKEMSKAFMGVALKIAMVGLAYKGIQKFVGAAKQQIPEIGQAFGIAKDIILKNFFWPIRQMIVPMLQKMLDWVRDNRGMFVKWGQVTVGVFKLVINIVKQFFQLIQPLTSRLFKNLGGDVTETANLVLAKIAVIVAFISEMIKPVIADLGKFFDMMVQSGVIKAFGDLAMAVGKVAWSAISGFFEGVSKAFSTNLKPFLDDLTFIFNTLGKTDGEGVRGAFKGLGEFLGNAFIVALRAAGVVINTIAGSLNMAKRSIEIIASIADPARALDIGNAMLRENRDNALMNMILSGGENSKQAQSEINMRAALLGKYKTKSEDQAMNAIGTLAKKIANEQYTLMVNEIKAGRWQNAKPISVDTLKMLNKLNEEMKLVDPIGSGIRGLEKSKAPFLQQTGGVEDGIVKQDGSIVHTDPKDTIIAHKGSISVNKNQGMTGGQFTVYLNVTEGNATQAGKNFAQGMALNLRQTMAMELTAGGN